MKPYQEQLEAAKIAAKAGRGVICMPTGFGKSVTMALLINEMQLKTLVVVPNLELKKQLRESFTRFFGDLSNITIENIGSPALKTATDYDCLIIDEAHHAAAKTYRDLNKNQWKGIYYRFFFTATPFRSRDDEQLLYESVCGQVIYRVEHSVAVDKGYIVPIEAYYYELPTIKPKGNQFNWHSMYSELVVNNEFRNKLIADVIVNLESWGLSTLCLVKEIKHGEELKRLTGLTHKDNKEVAFASGVEENTRILILEFTLRERNALIGTTGVLGEGVDTKPAEYIIIAGLGKSKNAFMQQVGRGFRRYEGKESCKVLLFKDKSHKWTLDHFKKQCKYLKDEYGVVPTKLELPEGMRNE